MQNLQIPFYQISCTPFFVRGAKREIRDKNGKLIFHARNSSIIRGSFFYIFKGKRKRIPLRVLEKDLSITKQNLKNQGCKNVKESPASLQLPELCPSCDNIGTATCYLDERVQKNTKIRITYNHNKTKPKRCFIGTYDIDNLALKVKAGIDFRKFSIAYLLGSKQTVSKSTK